MAIPRAHLWLYACLAAVGTLLVVVVVLVDRSLGNLATEMVVGPTPEEIQAHCQPVIDWILSEMQTSGAHPQQLPSEHAARLDELPYSWSYDDYGLSIGKLGALGGEWPGLLYSYQWSPGGWRGWDVSPDRRALIIEHCLPVTKWLQSEMERSHRLPEQLSDEHTAKLNELPYLWSYDHFGLRISDAATEPQYSYSWSPPSPGQWSWRADSPVSNEQARRILEDHGYYR